MQETNNRPVFNRKPRSPRKNRPIMLLFIILGCLVVLGIGNVKFLSKILVDVTKAELSVLEEVLPAEFFVMRTEIAVSAPFSGTLEWTCPEGERVAKGTVLGYLTVSRGTSLEKTEKVAVTAPLAGVVSYAVDGYETICNPQNWGQLNMADLAENTKWLEEKTVGDAKNKKAVEAGDLFFKITDNLEPVYFYVETKEFFPELFVRGKELKVRIDDIEQPVFTGMAQLSRTEDKTQMLLKLTGKQGFEGHRKLRGKIILHEYKGIVLSSQMLVTKEGRDGVYILNQGKAEWRTVQILGKDETKVSLAGIKPGEWVVTSPQLVQEGQRVFSLRR